MYHQNNSTNADNSQPINNSERLYKEIGISCKGRNLMPHSGHFSKSGTMVVVYIQPFGLNQWQEHSHTEVVMNSRNPDFTKMINIIYHFEEHQKLKCEVYNTAGTNMNQRELIGSVETTLGSLVSQQVIHKTIEHHGKTTQNRGTLILSSEELASSRAEVEIQLAAHNLDTMKYFLYYWDNKADPFVTISKSTENGEYMTVHKTEFINNTLNPVWKKIVLPVRNLNNGDYERTLRLACWHWNENGTHSLIGQADFSLQRLLTGPLPMTLYCINPEKKANQKNYQNSGKFEFVSCNIIPNYGFLDYIQGGTEINCTVAIDFTASNGDQHTPTSLHYIHGKSQTLYEQALSAVGEILEDYDTDKQFPVIGFGARIPPNWRVSHEFHVNFNPQNPYCDRISGIIAAYRSCVPLIRFLGPTNFAPAIRHVTRFAEEFNDGSRYFILLILTDGIITDMDDTKEAIVDASSLPMSIIIVGIGNADFGPMEELDSDDSLLTTSSGRTATQDIVQFVPFNKFLSANPAVARLHLAREVLREIPDQFMRFMKRRNINPKPPRLDIPLPPDPNIA